MDARELQEVHEASELECDVSEAQIALEAREARIAKEVEEIEAEKRMLQERGLVSPFSRGGLRRTPPKGFGPAVTTPSDVAKHAHTSGRADASRMEKRPLQSPEQMEQERSKRRQIEAVSHSEAVAVEGVVSAESSIDPLTTAPLEGVLGTATYHTKSIMDAVRSKTSKLNKDEIASIGANTERLTAIIGLLVVRAAAAERKLELAQNSTPIQVVHNNNLHQEPTSTYATMLKLGRSQEVRAVPVRQGPAVAVYPAEDQKESMKTAADTKMVLKSSVQPAKIGVTVSGIRPCGNGGVIVHTGSAKAAEALRKAIPPTLRTAEPKDRMPLIALTGAEQTERFEDIIENLFEQNLGDSKWTMTSLQKELRPLFKRQRGGNRCVWVCQATAPLRKHLVEAERVYIGWEVVEVTDYVGVTCCRKCQQFGHPEKYCRAKVVTCGKCGDDGHNKEDCKAAISCCATCKKFGRKGAEGHLTNGKECPARRYAEDRELARVNYG